MSDFRPRKKRVAAYFNNGQYTYAIWASGDGVKGHDKLIAAVDAAREAFTAAYMKGKGQKGGKHG